MKRPNYFNTKPKAIPIDVRAYLKRIGMKRENCSLNYLRHLHFAHVHSIPFENLDIHYQRKTILDYHRIFDKIIFKKRGGVCHELNGLFYHLLYHLGFDCYVASAQFRRDIGGYGPEYGHMIVMARFGNRRYLVDVGFEGAFSYPKEIVLNKVQMDYTTYWKLESDPDGNYLLKYSSDARDYHIKYRFNLDEKQIIQFMAMYECPRTLEEIMFAQKKRIAIKTKNGRVALTNHKLKVQELGEVYETDIMNEDEFLSKLEQYFGITYKQLFPLKK